jgi:hypothetical protein
VLEATFRARAASAPVARGPRSCDVARRPGRGAMESSTSVRDLEDRVAKLQRAVYYLIWKRTGFGEQCVHCGHAYPAHAERCKAAEVEALVR